MRTRPRQSESRQKLMEAAEYTREVSAFYASVEMVVLFRNYPEPLSEAESARAARLRGHIHRLRQEYMDFRAQIVAFENGNLSVAPIFAPSDVAAGKGLDLQ